MAFHELEWHAIDDVELEGNVEDINSMSLLQKVEPRY